MLYKDGQWRLHPDLDARPDIQFFLGEPVIGDLIDVRTDGIDPYEEAAAIADAARAVHEMPWINPLKEMQAVINESTSIRSEAERAAFQPPIEPSYQWDPPKRTYQFQPASWLAPRYLFRDFNHCISLACVTESIYHRFYNPADMHHWRNMLMCAGAYAGISTLVRSVLEIRRRLLNRRHRPVVLGIDFRRSQ